MMDFYLGSDNQLVTFLAGEFAILSFLCALDAFSKK